MSGVLVITRSSRPRRGSCRRRRPRRRRPSARRRSCRRRCRRSGRPPPPADDQVVAGAGQRVVVIGPGLDVVVSLLAVDLVVALLAVHLVGLAGAADQVVSGASVELVLSAAPDQHVVARPAVDDVVAAAALDLVVARSELDLVVAGLEVELGVVELVLELGAHDRLLCGRRKRSASSIPAASANKRRIAAWHGGIDSGPASLLGFAPRLVRTAWWEIKRLRPCGARNLTERDTSALLRRPTGLADGLALKGVRASASAGGGFAPDVWVPRSPMLTASNGDSAFAGYVRARQL